MSLGIGFVKRRTKLILMTKVQASVPKGEQEGARGKSGARSQPD